MDLSSNTMLLAGTALAVLVPAFIYSREITRWLRLKNYQYEATFALSMMTPMEKFVINSFLFLTLSMLIIAASLYLPEHVSTMSHRAFYYWSGKTNVSVATSSAAHTVKALGSHAAVTASSMASNVARVAVEMAKGTAVNTPAAAATPVEAVIPPPVEGMGL